MSGVGLVPMPRNLCWGGVAERAYAFALCADLGRGQS